MLGWAKLSRVLTGIALVPAVVGVIALTERGVYDPYNRTVGPKGLLKLIIRGVRGDITKITVCRCSPDREVRLRRDDGLTTAAGIYEPDGSERRPGILLIHGNTSLGRKLAMYRVLAAGLAERGYLVLTFDLPGWGESDDPFQFGMLEAVDNDNMVPAAVEYLINKTNVDKNNIAVIGHSGGAMPALKWGITMDEIKKIILIGPPRRVRERMAHTSGINSFWRRFRQTHEFVYGTPIPEWFTADMFAERVQGGAMEEYLDYFSMNGHKPLMLVDGEHESEADKVYLEEYYAMLAKPRKFVRLRASDHYGNTAQSLGVIFYDKGVMHQLVSEVTQWLGRATPRVGEERKAVDDVSCDVKSKEFPDERRSRSKRWISVPTSTLLS